MSFFTNKINQDLVDIEKRREKEIYFVWWTIKEKEDVSEDDTVEFKKLWRGAST